MTNQSEVEETKDGLVGDVYGIYVDYSTNLGSGEITFKDKEALDHYITKARIDEYKYLLTYLDGRIKNYGRTKDNDNMQAHLRQKLAELKKGNKE